jgi:hypothetical protein
MYHYKNEKNESICRFGPGGDFSYNWPGKSINKSTPPPNSLNKLLGTIAEIINVVLGSDLYSSTTVSSMICPKTNQVLCRKEKIEYAVKNNKTDKSTYSKTTTIIKSNSSIPVQQLLFADDCGAGSTTEHKPKHHIRTHKRASKKRSVIGLQGQSTLFEDNLKSARSA